MKRDLSEEHDQPTLILEFSLNLVHFTFVVVDRRLMQLDLLFVEGFAFAESRAR